MAQTYFCGTDLYSCLQFSEDSANNKIFRTPEPISNFCVEFTHFYAVYKKNAEASNYSWFMTGLSLPETQIFSSALRIRQVATCKNLIVGLSEDNHLYQVRLETDDNTREAVSFKTSEIKLPQENVNPPFQKIASNEDYIFCLQSSPDLSRILKLGNTVEGVAEFSGKNIVDFSVGYGHFVALSDTGAIWNWGECGRSEIASNSEGEVNLMSKQEVPKRVEFFDDLPSIIVRVVCGGWHTLALTSDGDIYSWGWNESGQLGHNASAVSKNYPYPIDLGSAEDPVVDVAAGSRHSVALLRSGRVFSWGRNHEGQAGLGNEDSSAEPKEIDNCWDGNVSKIKCGKWSTFITTSLD